MLDRITGMQVFTRVASFGSLSAAARSLSLSQTLVTKHIAALERQLNSKLFLRSTRGLTLTVAGERYLEGVGSVLSAIEALEEKAIGDNILPRGLLRLNAPVSFGHLILAPLLKEFSERYPQVNLEIGLTDNLVNLVDEGWDLAIRIGKLRESSLRARKLASCNLVVCASPDYLRLQGIPQTVEELSDHNCIGYTLSEHLGTRKWLFSGGEHSVEINGTLRINNGDAIVKAALDGYGIIYQPTFIVHDYLREGRLVALILDHPTLQIHDVFAVFEGARQLPRKVRVFIDFLLEKFQPQAPWDAGL